MQKELRDLLSGQQPFLEVVWWGVFCQRGELRGGIGVIDSEDS